MKWKELHKIAVTGSRKFRYCDLATQWIDAHIREIGKQLDEVVVITGGARGVDAAIEIYCERRGIKNLVVHARWLELDKAAGPIRNKHIVDLCNELIVFWDGKSKGTNGTMRYAKGNNKKVIFFTQVSLRNKMHTESVPLIKVPRHASKRDAHQLRQLVADADIGELKKLYSRKRNLAKQLRAQ